MPGTVTYFEMGPFEATESRSVMASLPRMTEGQIKRRRAATTIVIGAVVVALALISYGAVIVQQISNVEREWRENAVVAHGRDETLFRLQSALGYGGFIHHFKNFVLRAELEALDSAKADIARAAAAIDDLVALGVGEEFPRQLRLIRDLVRAYEVRLVIADEAFVDGYTANQIDAMVRIDDAAALQAIEELSSRLHRNMLAVQAESQERLQDAIRTAMFGLLLLPLIAAFAWLMLRFLREQIAANQREKAATQQIATIIDTNPEAMLLVGRDGRIVRTNEAATTLLGYDSQQLVGSPITRFAPDGPEGAWQNEIMRLFDEPVRPAGTGARVWRGLKLWAIHDDGTRVPIGVSAGISGEGDDAQITMLLNDETPRLNYEAGLIEAREAAERASRAKSDFLANVSHEVRTPINAIIGLSGLAAKTSLNPQQNDYVTKIHSAGRRLLDVVNDMLDFARIDAGQMELVEHPFDILDLTEQIATIAAIGAEEKGLELILRVDRRMPRQLVGDQNRIAQVLSGLINNAIKFTADGAVTVDVSCAPADSGRGGARQGYSRHGDGFITLTVAVTDTGIGIAPADLDGLFEAFSQADTSVQRVHGGTGLGLAICRSLVESMHGTITAESEAGKGSTFQFTARLRLTGDESVVDALPEPPEGRLLRIALADDSAQVRDVLGRELGDAGFAVSVMANGSDCINGVLAATRDGDPFDVLLVDRDMPGTDGMVVVTRLAEELEPDERPRIFLLASYGSVDPRRLAKRLPITGVLDKPVITAPLINTMVSALNAGEPVTLVQPPVHQAREAAGAGDEPAAEPRPMSAGETRFAAFMGNEDAQLLDSAADARVLIVEDNKINQQVAVEMLEHLGIETVIADNGLAALNKLRDNPPDYFDIVLMDVQMPGMDGLTATRHIRGDDRFAGLPIVALTAHALGDDRERCFEAGMDGHLTKPIGPRQLVATLNAWVGRERPEPSVVSEDQPPQAALADDPAIDGDPSNQPLFDEQRLESLRELSDGFLEKMLGDFRERYHASATDIRTYLAEQETEKARSLAHTIKGTSGSLGAQRLFACARALDLALRASEDDATIAELTDQFEDALDLTCAVIAKDFDPEAASVSH